MHFKLTDEGSRAYVNFGVRGHQGEECLQQWLGFFFHMAGWGRGTDGFYSRGPSRWLSYQTGQQCDTFRLAEV